jgi:hypothetical protein
MARRARLEFILVLDGKALALAKHELANPHHKVMTVSPPQPKVVHHYTPPNETLGCVIIGTEYVESHMPFNLPT